VKVSTITGYANALVFMLLLSISGSLLADETDFEPIHWAYSSFFGTGWYQIQDSRSVFVMRMPIRQTIRESSLSDTGERQTGIQIKYPLTLGLHDVDDIGGILEQDNFGTVSFTPGIEFEFPINDRWYMRSFVHAGWGKELNTGDSAWIYYAGVKSQYAFPGEKYDWYLLNSLYYAGYAPDSGRSDHLAVAQLGAELRQPLSKATLFGRNIDLHWTLMYSFLGNELHFNLPDGNFDPIEDQFEATIAISLRDGPYKLWFFNIHRLGIGYQVSSNGQFKAITFQMRSWFTQ
jgi:hypothetical protein